MGCAIFYWKKWALGRKTGQHSVWLALRFAGDKIILKFAKNDDASRLSLKGLTAPMFRND